MALLVIPELKLSDKGLFDGTKFEFTPLLVIKLILNIYIFILLYIFFIFLQKINNNELWQN